MHHRGNPTKNLPLFYISFVLINEVIYDYRILGAIANEGGTMVGDRTFQASKGCLLAIFLLVAAAAMRSQIPGIKLPGGITLTPFGLLLLRLWTRLTTRSLRPGEQQSTRQPPLLGALITGNMLNERHEKEIAQLKKDAGEAMPPSPASPRALPVAYHWLLSSVNSALLVNSCVSPEIGGDKRISQHLSNSLRELTEGYL